MKTNLAVKTKLLSMCFGAAAAALLAGAAAADNVVVTRSTADIEADMLRTYKTHGGAPAGNLRVRSEADAHADLVRDWGAKPSGVIGKSVRTRSGGEGPAPLVASMGRAPGQY